MLQYRPPAPTGRRRRAFTLIELIVVVTIIAILASIAGVAYNYFVGQARDTALHADAVQTDLAITAKSAQDDQTPSALVAAAFASGTGVVDTTAADSRAFATYFSIHVDTSTPLLFTPDSLTAPTGVTVSLGSRAECLTLGTEPGMAATITKGVCSGTTIPGAAGATGTAGSGTTSTPQAPAGLKFAPAGANGYTLTWTDPAGVDGVSVYRSNNGGSTWTKMTDVAAPTATWTDASPGTTPAYSLVSYTNSGATSSSPGTAGSTTATPPLPSGTVQTVVLGSGKAPIAMAAAPDGIYGVLMGSTAFVKINPDTGASTAIATLPDKINGFAVGSDGTLYATDVAQQTIVTVDKQTGALTPISAPFGQVLGDLTMGQDGKLYAIAPTTTGYDPYVVVQFDPATRVFTRLYSLGAGQINHLTMGSDGMLYASWKDSSGGLIVKVDPSAKTESTWFADGGGGAYDISDIGSDHNGNVYFEDGNYAKTLKRKSISTGVVTSLGTKFNGVDTMTRAWDGNSLFGSDGYAIYRYWF